jgi:hypothetical protein
MSELTYVDKVYTRPLAEFTQNHSDLWFSPTLEVNMQRYKWLELMAN